MTMLWAKVGLPAREFAANFLPDEQPWEPLKLLVLHRSILYVPLEDAVFGTFIQAPHWHVGTINDSIMVIPTILSTAPAPIKYCELSNSIVPIMPTDWLGRGLNWALVFSNYCTLCTSTCEYCTHYCEHNFVPSTFCEGLPYPGAGWLVGTETKLRQALDIVPSTGILCSICEYCTQYCEPLDGWLGRRGLNWGEHAMLLLLMTGHSHKHSLLMRCCFNADHHLAMMLMLRWPTIVTSLIFAVNFLFCW